MSSSPRPSRGRPRSADVDAAVLAATAEVLDQQGYHALAVEDVARRAGVSKSAIYRRWPDRTRLALAVLTRRLTDVESPDSGCTLCDLDELLALVSACYCALGPGTIAQLLAETTTDAALREDVVGAMLEPVRAAAHRTLHRARERGDLRADVDLALLVESMSALVFHRLLLDEQVLDQAERTTLVTMLLRGAATEPTALLSQYQERQHGVEHEHPVD